MCIVYMWLSHRCMRYLLGGGENAKYCKISAFSKQIGKHNNTIDEWFRELEGECKLHYISRVNEEKVYDELDLSIAKFIVKRRENK